MKKTSSKSILIYVLISFLITNIIYISYSFKFFEPLELNVIDFLFNKRIKKEKNFNNILIVNIDNKAIKKYSFPLSRDIYGYLIQKAKENDVKIIAFDLIFDKFNTENKADLYFLTQMSKFDNIILSMQYSYDNTLLFANDYLRNYSKGEGFINISTDIDGKIRGADLFYQSFDKNGNSLYYISFASFIYKELLGINNFKEFVSYTDNNTNKYNGKVLINFVGKSDSFPSISILDILDENFDFSIFKNKVVLVGPTFSTSQDFYMTPYNKIINKKLKNFKIASSISTSGVEIHANILNTLLNKNSFKRFNYNYFVFIFISILIAICIFPKFNLIISTSFTILIGLITFLIIFISFQFNIIIETIPLIFLMLFLYINTSIFKIILTQIEKLYIQGIFGKYLAPEIVKELLKFNNNLQLGGESKNISILFSDIANFTSISEQFSSNPEQIVDFLNKYFDKMINIINTNHGILDKFIGDAVMALFGAPIESDHADNAIKSAIEMKKQVNILRDEWKNDFDFNVRIGINTGQVVIGNIGSIKRMEYTVIGDSVNLASRLEGVNKVFDTNIIISEFTYNEIKNKNNFLIRELDLIRVKGKNKPVKIYEIIDFNTSITKSIKDNINIFHEAINLYRNLKFYEAKKLFLTLKKDEAVNTYIQRCNDFINNPPKDNWDKVFTLTKK